jgi:hypothetical protein
MEPAVAPNSSSVVRLDGEGSRSRSSSSDILENKRKIHDRNLPVGNTTTTEIEKGSDISDRLATSLRAHAALSTSSFTPATPSTQSLVTHIETSTDKSDIGQNNYINNDTISIKDDRMDNSFETKSDIESSTVAVVVNESTSVSDDEMPALVEFTDDNTVKEESSGENKKKKMKSTRAVADGCRQN